MGRRHLSPGTLTAPLPAVMVTVGDMENANIITVAWTGILATHPPKAYISVRPSRHSHAMLKQGGEFVINLTTEKLLFATDFSGIYTGAKIDKFERLKLTKEKSREVAPPTIGESPLALECRVSDIVSMGTHDVFIADIVSVSCDESILDDDGKIDLGRTGLIAYAHGEYYELGRALAKFGFSAVKKSSAGRQAEQKSAKPRTAPATKPCAAQVQKTREANPKDKGSAATEEKEPFYVGALKYKRKRGRK